MRIGLLSDTHVPEARESLPPQVKETFRGVDMILHAGDIYRLSVLDELQTIAPVLAARGDDDHFRLLEDPRVKEKHLLTIDGLKLGLTHVVPYPETLWQTLDDRMKRDFGGPVDILVFGDTHEHLVETFKGVLLVNPGSTTLPFYRPRLGTVGILTIESGKARAEIIQLV
ncbi:MAG: metallophosphoesterase family protein [Dehalococcoidia bacterium]|nr:metallophosphoesterase family protein [Dehalococcoidia bacterium]